MRKPEALRKLAESAREKAKTAREKEAERKAILEERQRHIEDAQITNKIEESERLIEHAAADGKMECVIISKLKTHTDKADSRFVREVRNHFEKEGFTTELRYDHDGVGIESWHNLVVSWAEEEKEEAEADDVGVYAKSVNEYTHTPAKDDGKVPVYRGCRNVNGCFCTGKCQEIIGYRDKLPGEL